jgi:hypothetical protein
LFFDSCFSISWHRCCQRRLQTASKEVTMKTLNVLPFAFAVMIFSGCYTQLVVEDDDPWSTSDQPEYTASPEPIVIYVPEPYPVYVPSPGPGPIIPPGNPTPPAPPVQRPTGVQRPRPEGPQQDKNKNSGVTRGADQNGLSQNSQAGSQIAVPTRGNSDAQSPSPQPSSQNNSTMGRRR